jgi:hypothetical protein
MSVARSVAMRNGMALESGLRLWLAYNERLLDEWRRHPFPLLSFDLPKADLVERIRTALLRLAIEGLPQPPPLDVLLRSYHDELVHARPASSTAMDGIEADLWRRVLDMHGWLRDAAEVRGEPIKADDDQVIGEAIRARRLINDKRPADALKIYDCLLTAKAGAIDTWIAAVEAASAIDDQTRSHWLARALTAHPADPWLLMQQADSEWQHRRHDQALALAERARTAAPGWWLPRRRLGAWCSNLGRWDQVIQHLEEEGRNPRLNAWWAFLLAVAYARTGRFSEGSALALLAVPAIASAEARAQAERLWIATCTSTGADPDTVATAIRDRRD